ncbi:MAG: hypothetical protein JXL20_05480 [Deltaproteobacteria bacterium]|nr:hypothetical protein [Deltaproteobacteria bacterium]
MQTSRNIIFRAFGVCLLSFLFGMNLTPALAAEATVVQGHGVTFSQIDFPSYETPMLDSNIGIVNVDASALRQATGMGSGYLNVNVNDVWIVRNLPVFSGSEYPYSAIATEFDLGITPGTDVSSFNASVKFSDGPATVFPGGSSSSFSVGKTGVAVSGAGDTVPAAAPSPPTMNDVLFGPAENTNPSIQYDHPISGAR